MVVEDGYKQTDAGVIPSDWNVEKLGNVAIFFNGKAHENYISDFGDYVVVNSKFISSDGKIAKFSLKNDCKLSENDITIVMSDIPNGKALAKCFIIDKNDIYALNQRIGGLRSLGAFPKYLFYQLNRNTYFLGYDSGSGQTNLRKQEVLDCPVIIPPLPEQTAIATALSDMDALIAQTEKLIEKKKAIKQGVMQELLRPREGWVTKKLGDYGKTYGGLTGKTKADFGKGNGQYIPFMNIMSNPIIDLDYLDEVNIKSGEAQNKAMKGDLFFNGSSETPEEVGLCSVLTEEVENLYLNSFCFGYRMTSQNDLNGLFLSYLFRSPLGRNLIFSLAQGATRYNLSKTNLLKLELPIPSKNEQDNIVKILLDLDSLIKANETILQKLKLQKQGMMQALLTGKIRLV